MTEKLHKELKADFPEHAYSQDKSRGSSNPMTSLKPQFIRERLNEVFGIFGWWTEGGFEKLEHGVLWIGKLWIEQPIEDDEITPLKRYVEAVGYAETHQRKAVWDNGKKVPGKFDLTLKNQGDVYKSAMTDALSKAASNIGVGDDMFKGFIDPYSFQNVSPLEKWQTDELIEDLKTYGNEITDKTLAWVNGTLKKDFQNCKALIRKKASEKIKNAKPDTEKPKSVMDIRTKIGE